jgi:hypothetical protein
VAPFAGAERALGPTTTPGLLALRAELHLRRARARGRGAPARADVEAGLAAASSLLAQSPRDAQGLAVLAALRELRARWWPEDETDPDAPARLYAEAHALDHGLRWDFPGGTP